MNSKSTKRALISSAIALIVCISMLIGTTFAWFTDNVSSSNNIIKSGNLDVELEYSVFENGAWTTYQPVTDTTKVFNYDNWEPGYTSVAKFRISNNGSLALKYELNAVVTNETGGINKAGDPFKLSECLKYGVTENIASLESRETALAAATTHTFDSFGLKTSTLEKGKSAEVGVVIAMPTSIDDKANHNGTAPSITFDIKLFATQYTSESDSFGPNYDDAAWVVAHADAVVDNQAELDAALQNGGLVALASNIDGDVTLSNVAEDTILNFAGKTINGTVTVNEGQAITFNGVGGVSATGSAPAITLGKNTDVTLAGGTFTSEDEAINIANKKTEVPMKLTIEKGTVITAPTIIWLDQSGGYAGADIVINGGEFNSTYTKSDARPIKVHGGNVTINGGTFTIDNPTGSNCYFVDVSSKYNTETGKNEVGNVIINGGTFISNVARTSAVFASVGYGHIAGTVEINGGTFEFTADNSYLVDAYAKVVVNNCTYIGTKAACVFNGSNNNNTDRTIEVNGGNYTVRTSPRGSFISNSYSDRLILKGGTINSNKYIDGSLATGYKLVDNGDGTYSVKAE